MKTRLIRVYGKDDVVVAAKKRIVSLYTNNTFVYVSFSGGKESLAMAHLIFELYEDDKIDITKTRVVFIDEEAIYPDVEKIVKLYRKKFLKIGATFYWLCLPVKHFNCFNLLYNDESFICWDMAQKENWIREIPKYAMTSHPLLKLGETYQEFLAKIHDGPMLIGLRAAESFQRLKALSSQTNQMKTKDNKVYPIYDWSLNDTWYFILDRNIPIPEAYIYMWKVGVSVSQLRISQFFSIDTARSLVKMFEFYPDLYEKILKREPNAYLAMMYWDSDMFRRNTSSGKDKDGNSENSVSDIKKASYAGLTEFRKRDAQHAKQLESFLTTKGSDLTDAGWKVVLEIVTAGDPKGRTIRRLYTMMK